MQVMGQRVRVLVGDGDDLLVEQLCVFNGYKK